MTLRNGLAPLVALAVIAAPTAATGQTQASADDSKIVCKNQDRTNSRFKDKVCKTRAEWEQMRIQQQRDAREFIDRPLVNGQRSN